MVEKAQQGRLYNKMRAIQSLTFFLTITSIQSQVVRHLRKDYGKNGGKNGYYTFGKSSMNKSGKGRKSAKGSYALYNKSKSAKSGTTYTSDNGAYYGDDGLTSNSFEVKFDDDFNYDDATEYDDDAPFVVDDSPLDVMGGLEESIDAEDAADNANVDAEADDNSLTQNSWLTDLISTNDDDDDTATEDAPSLEDNANTEETATDDEESDKTVVSESGSVENTVTNDKISDNNDNPTLDKISDEDDSLTLDELFIDNVNKSTVDDDISFMADDFGLETSMSLDLDQSLDQNSWLSNLISGNNEDDSIYSMSMEFKPDLEDKEVTSESSVVIVDDQVLELDLESSMSISKDDEELGTIFDVSMSMDSVDGVFDFIQAGVDIGSMSMFGGVTEDENDINTIVDNEIVVAEKDTTSELGVGGDEKDDDGDTDDNIDSIGINSSFLTQDERTEIILEKCNTSPLSRALSLIQIIGNHIDPQGE